MQCWCTSFEPYAVLGLYNSELVMSDGCKFTDNISTYAVALYNTKITVSDTDFVDDKTMAIYESDDSAYGSAVSRCKFSRGTPTEYYKDTFQFNGNSNIQFTECDFGDATALGFDLGSIALLQGKTTEVGSMVGNGSLSMLISLAALAVSVVCLGVTLTIYKKISVKSEDNK